MENWVGIASLVVSLGIAGIMIYMYKKGKMPESDISNIAGLIDQVTNVLNGLGKGESLVAVFAEYAAKAVRIVEQMVKNGQLEKDNEVRKCEARAIVEQLAIADGVDAEMIFTNTETIDNLIEAAVNEMQTPVVVIEQNLMVDESKAAVL